MMVTLEMSAVRKMSLLGVTGEAHGWPPSLCQHELREDFSAWHGASGRRYVASVFVVDTCAADAGLPAFDAFVLIAVVREGLRRRAKAIVAVERGSTRHDAVVEATAAGGVDEWHVHLLGASRAEREAIVADLRAGAGLGVHKKTA